MFAWPLFVVAFLELGLATQTPWWVAVWLAWAGLATGFVGVVYLASRPSWLGKGTSFPPFLFPYLVLARSMARVAQRLGLIERQEIVPGLWVGGWPRRGAPGLAQLDLTAELPRRGSAAMYRNIPMLDGAVPRREDWDAAVAQVLEWRKEGRDVLVHCAYGHGRSVAVVVGVLVHEGLAADPVVGLAMVRAVRPRARLTAEQTRFVDAVTRDC